ncbi:MAG: hypothetical protein AMXMBFR49_27040 [Chlorobiota bacterium]
MPPGYSLADIRDRSALARIFENFSPEMVLHLAGITAVSHALALTEQDVHDINVTASGILAKLSNAQGAKIIYTSTDLVFDGSIGGNLKEDSPTRPLSLYASTKLAGEKAVTENTDNYLILRVALMYGFSKGKLKAFFQEAYNKVKSGHEVVLFHDQYRSSLLVNDGARMLVELVSKEHDHKMINFGAAERTSRANLFQRFARKAGLDESLLVFKSFRDTPHLPQVEDVSLDVGRLMSVGITPKSVDESVEDIVNEIN